MSTMSTPLAPLELCSDVIYSTELTPDCPPLGTLVILHHLIFSRVSTHHLLTYYREYFFTYYVYWYCPLPLLYRGRNFVCVVTYNQPWHLVYSIYKLCWVKNIHRTTLSHIPNFHYSRNSFIPNHDDIKAQRMESLRTQMTSVMKEGLFQSLLGFFMCQSIY